MLAASLRFLGLGLLALASGCAMCGACDDYTYGAYGGRWDRLDQSYGRVGSIFTPEVGTRVEPDVVLSPGANPAEELPAGSAKPVQPQPLDGMPAEQAQPDGTPAEPMPGEDSAPMPPDKPVPDSVTQDGKANDSSVLRKAPRPLR